MDRTYVCHSGQSTPHVSSFTHLTPHAQSVISPKLLSDGACEMGGKEGHARKPGSQSAEYGTCMGNRNVRSGSLVASRN